MRTPIRWRRWAGIALVLAALAFLASAAVLEWAGRSPRELAPYLQKRSSGHNAWIEGGGARLAALLVWLDRGADALYPMPELQLGAGSWAATSLLRPAPLRTVAVTSQASLRAAIAQAEPGDQIVIVPGTYMIDQGDVQVVRPGRAEAPIVVRAETLGSVHLLMQAGEGFRVAAPYWIFENLHVRGVCRVQFWCEHAFHVVGKAHHFIARNNLLEEFSAHFKVNMEEGQIPDSGIIEYNSLINRAVRQTEHAVTAIDIVAASDWRIEGNQVRDFIKAYSDKVSYGIFVKGAGMHNRILRNSVVCEHLFRHAPGQRVGISLGGGGTAPAYCRDGQCAVEQRGSLVAGNLIASCSDDGLYLNRAAESRLLNNTLLDTGGVVVRYPQSQAWMAGNLVDGRIRSREGGQIQQHDNQDSAFWQIYLGWHPVRMRFREPAVLDLGWRTAPAPLAVPLSDSADLCLPQTRIRSEPGAFADFSACWVRR